MVRELSPEEFPPFLRELPDPPKRLFAEGMLPSKRSKILTVVGSRKHSDYGRQAAESLIDGLRGHDVVIVSGLALGLDAVAHRAAMRAGLQTIAVPGSGLDKRVLYPRSHARLAEEILARGGGLLSEFEPTTPAAPWTFPQRNRVMAGMAHAVLVVEAELRSGTLITARLAADYSKDVLAVPGPIFSRTSDGPHMLMRLGATPVRTSADVLDALGIADARGPAETKAAPGGLSQDEKKVYEILREPMSRDLLIQRLGMGTTNANILLSAMELKGLIAESLGEVRIS